MKCENRVESVTRCLKENPTIKAGVSFRIYMLAGKIENLLCDPL
jgi:hypothetical protein